MPILPARFACYAYKSDPTEIRGLIFAVNEKGKEQEYLVQLDPIKQRGRLSTLKVPMDKSRRIDNREMEDGRLTRDIDVLERNKWISPITSGDVWETLRYKAGEELPEIYGYKVKFIEHTPG